VAKTWILTRTISGSGAELLDRRIRAAALAAA